MSSSGQDVVSLVRMRERQGRRASKQRKPRTPSCQQARGGQVQAPKSAEDATGPSNGPAPDASSKCGAQLASPIWFLHRQQTRPLVPADDRGSVFDIEIFHKALEASPLKRKVRDTLLEVLYSADEVGRTTMSGRRLAARLGIREATVSNHLSKAREAHFLLTKYRYNRSPVHQLAWPGSRMHPPQPGISPLDSRIWSDSEMAWWSSLHTDRPLPPPWSSGEPPF